MKRALSVAMLVLLGAACALSENARQYANWPQVQAAWPAVREDVERGGPPASLLAAMDVAIASDELVLIRAANWVALEPVAQRGIAMSGHSEGVKKSMQEQLRNFDASVQQIQRSVK